MAGYHGHEMRWCAQPQGSSAQCRSTRDVSQRWAPALLVCPPWSVALRTEAGSLLPRSVAQLTQPHSQGRRLLCSRSALLQALARPRPRT